jgi:hypothetical protein
MNGLGSAVGVIFPKRTSKSPCFFRNTLQTRLKRTAKRSPFQILQNLFLIWHHHVYVQGLLAIRDMMTSQPRKSTIHAAAGFGAGNKA